MRCRLLIRTCCLAAFCGLLALTLAASADTTPQTSTSSKNKPVHHSASTAKAPSSHSSASKTSSHKTKRARSKAKSRKRGQQAIDSERAQQIQQALIREHYLQGEPSGKWDATTQTAMQRYQADQGWQTKTIPDSRALIKLGLGPSAEHLLNPDSAMTTSVVRPSGKSDSKSNADDPPKSPSESPSGDPPQQ